jgi:hypothetical protein
MIQQLLEHGGVGVGVHATQHVESNPQLPASATDTDGPSHPHPNVPARSPSGEATLKRLRVANDNEKVGYDLSDKKSSDFYIDCMTLHQGELPAHFGGTHDTEKAYKQKAKTCLSFYKAMQTDEEKSTMLTTVQGLSCEDLAALKGERRKIAESLTKLLASKLTHEFKANMGDSDKLPPIAYLNGASTW